MMVVDAAPLPPFAAVSLSFGMPALERGAFLRPDAVNDTNKLELFCFANEDKKTLWLAARLDNLGKGASGACVQNLNLALGFPE
ncbi:argC, partial [Symbiodinium sp. CCMP2456]